MITTEAAPPADTSLQASEDAASAALFQEEVGHDLPPVQEPEIRKNSAPAKEPPAKGKAEPKPEEKSEFPDELLGGAAKKPEAKPAEEDPLEAEPKGQINHEHFKRAQTAAKERIAAAAKERDEARAELDKALKSRGEPSEDQVKTVASLQSELARMKEELSRVAFERTPEFQERFTDKEARIREMAIQDAIDAGADAKVIDRALALRGRERAAVLEEAELSHLAPVLAQYDLLQREKADVLKGSKERMATWQAEQQTKKLAAEQDRKAREDRAWDEATRETSAEYQPFKKVEGNDAWNQKVEENYAKAKQLYNDGNVSDKDLAKVAMRAVAADVLERMLAQAVAKANAANARIAELQGAGPDINGNGQHRALGDTTGLSEDELAKRNFEEAMAGR